MTDTTDDGDFTPEAWRKQRKISKSTHYKLKRLGRAPEELRIPGVNIIRITHQADRQWAELMAVLASNEAAQLEQQRRVDAARRAGKAAVASPKHVSKRAKQKRRA